MNLAIDFVDCNDSIRSVRDLFGVLHPADGPDYDAFFRRNHAANPINTAPAITSHHHDG